MIEDGNSAKGRSSYDVQVGDMVIPFFNRNVMPYATESSGPKFDLVPVEKQKDVMINVARLHAQQEYDRIMDLVSVLQKQANQIKRRLEITDAVHAAKYDFKLAHGGCYWLVFDTRHKITRLISQGPDEWSCTPVDYEFMCCIKWMGDYSWQEIDKQGNFIC